MHYFGICICGEGDSPEVLMAPYDENDEEFFVEEIGEVECLDEYLSSTADFHISPDGQKFFKWESPYAPHWEGELFSDGRKYVTPELPEGWREENLPLKEYYPNIGKFLEDYKGYEYDKERNVHFARYNPDGKFDYMRIGGRWQGHITATAGNRVDDDCWEIADWREKHPDEEPFYKEHDFDWAMLDDIIKDEQTTPYFVVLPDGEWLEKDSWDEPGRVWDGNKDEADDIAKWRDAFWEKVVAPHLGKGCTAYAIDIHD